MTHLLIHVYAVTDGDNRRSTLLQRRPGGLETGDSLGDALAFDLCRANRGVMTCEYQVVWLLGGELLLQVNVPLLAGLAASRIAAVFEVE